MIRLLLYCCFLLGLHVVQAQERPNILFIFSDDHDADAISAYNKTLIATPGIDRLAKEGMKFNKHFVSNAICAPARATILTGKFSHMNGHRDNRTAFDTIQYLFPGKCNKQAIKRPSLVNGTFRHYRQDLTTGRYCLARVTITGQGL